MNKNFGPLPPEPAVLAEQSPSTLPMSLEAAVHRLQNPSVLTGVQERRTGGGLGATGSQKSQTCPNRSLSEVLNSPFLLLQSESELKKGMELLVKELQRRNPTSGTPALLEKLGMQDTSHLWDKSWHADSLEASVAQGFEGFGVTAGVAGLAERVAAGTRFAVGATAQPESSTPPGVLIITPGHFEGNPDYLTPEAAQTFCQNSAGLLTFKRTLAEQVADAKALLLRSFQKAQE